MGPGGAEGLNPGDRGHSSVTPSWEEKPQPPLVSLERPQGPCVPGASGEDVRFVQGQE